MALCFSRDLSAARGGRCLLCLALAWWHFAPAPEGGGRDSLHSAMVVCLEQEEALFLSLQEWQLLRKRMTQEDGEIPVHCIEGGFAKVCMGLGLGKSVPAR